MAVFLAGDLAFFAPVFLTAVFFFAGLFFFEAAFFGLDFLAGDAAPAAGTADPVASVDSSLAGDAAFFLDAVFLAPGFFGEAFLGEALLVFLGPFAAFFAGDFLGFLGDLALAGLLATQARVVRKRRRERSFQ